MPTGLESRGFTRRLTSADRAVPGMPFGFRYAPGAKGYLITLRQKSKYADAQDTASNIAHIGAKLIRTAVTGNMWIPKDKDKRFRKRICFTRNGRSDQTLWFRVTMN